MVEHLGLAAVVIDPETAGKLEPGYLESVPHIVTDGNDPMGGEDPFARLAAEIDGSLDAIVQHTSGTTGNQKGIGFCGNHIAVHAAAYGERLELAPDDVIASWLPLYHDMGFIACFVTPLVLGNEIVEMSPFDWVQQPRMLLDAISRQKAAYCWLPNFAFNVLSSDRVVGELAAENTPDLSHVKAFISCSEPVLAQSIHQFAAKLGRFGVRRSQVIASYAMAENLFAVTQNALGEPREISIDRAALEAGRRAELTAADAPGSVVLVSNGRCLATTKIEVRSDRGERLDEGGVGLLHISGDHRFRGYLGRDDLTRQAIDADGFYNTGDIGFMLDGHVYVSGRQKDLIIIRGRNYLPHEIETEIGEVEGVVPGRVVCFSVPDQTAGTEKLVVMLEVIEGYEKARGRMTVEIRTRVAQRFDCTVGDLRMVPPRSLVKSTAGKMARNDNRKRYLEMIAEVKDGHPAHV